VEAREVAGQRVQAKMRLERITGQIPKHPDKSLPERGLPSQEPLKTPFE
jgi:hypothetical protein